MRFCMAAPFQSVGARSGERGRARSFVGLPVALHHPQRDDVEQQRNDEQHEAEREGRERLGAVELLIAGQQLDDLRR
jgi:hypothetical protein